MMKRMLPVLLGLLLLLTACGTATLEPIETPNPPETVEQPVQTEEADALTDIRQQAGQQSAALAVVFLGISDAGDYDTLAAQMDELQLREVYPFLQGITEGDYVQQDGYEVYAALAVDPEATLVVRENVMDETTFTDAPGAELHRSQGAVLLKGNVSEIFPNFHLTVEKGGETVLTYCPQLSMEHGGMQAAEGVCTIATQPQLELTADGADVIYAGTWYTRGLMPNGDEMTMVLTMENDGRAEYHYGYPAGEVVESFEGSWSDDGLLHFDLYGGPVGETDSHYAFASTFRWDFEGRHLALEHAEGNPLLFGLEGGQFYFLPFDAKAFAGTYTAWSESNIHLELYENAEARYWYQDAIGETYELHGYWTVMDGRMEIGVGAEDGSQYMSGEFEVAITQEGLELTWLSGDNLTPMQLDGQGMERFLRG